MEELFSSSMEFLERDYALLLKLFTAKNGDQTFKQILQLIFKTRSFNNDSSITDIALINNNELDNILTIINNFHTLIQSSKKYGFNLLLQQEANKILTDNYDLALDLIYSKQCEITNKNEYEYLCEILGLPRFSISHFFKFKKQGRQLYNLFQSICCNLEELFYLENYCKLPKVLENLITPRMADLNIISIGCVREPKQQIYPWVFDIAARNPEIKISIYLFDDFYHGINTSVIDVNAGVPDFFEQNSDDWVELVDPAISTELKLSWIFNHKELKNITINVPNVYFPNKASLIAPKVEQQLLDTVKNLLLNNKLVIFSDYTDNYCINELIIKMFNDINQDKSDINVDNLLVLIQYEDMIKNQNFYVYQKNIIDAVEHSYYIFLEQLKAKLNQNSSFMKKNEIIAEIVNQYKKIVDNVIEKNGHHYLKNFSIRTFALYEKYAVNCDIKSNSLVEVIRTYLENFNMVFKNFSSKALLFYIENILSSTKRGITPIIRPRIIF